MQAASWTSENLASSLASSVASSASPERSNAHRKLSWYVAFALLTTLAEALFLLSSMPYWMLG